MPINSRGSADTLFQRIASGRPDHLTLDGSRKIQARNWFRDRAKQVSSVNTTQFFNQAEHTRKADYIGQAQIGQMFTFWYNAKHKKKLPFWDMFPLIFVIESYSDGFLGINLHYLPLQYRAKLMDALYKNINNKAYNESTRLMLSYRLLKSAAKYRYFKPCVKRYLFSQVTSQFMRIDPLEWDMALCLPTERFQKVKRDVVWQESVAAIQGSID